MLFKKDENKLIKELKQEIELLTGRKAVYQLALDRLEMANEELQREVDALKLKEAGYKERLKYASDKEVEAIEMANESAEERLLRQEAYDRLGKKFEEVCQKLSVEEEQNKRWEQEMGRLQEDYNSLKREYRKLQEAIPRKPQPTATIKVDTKEIQEMLENYLQEIKEEYSPRIKEEPEYEYWFEEKWSSTRCQVCESPQQLLNRVYAYFIPNYGGILTLSEGLIEMVTRKKPKDVIIETYSETPVEIYSTRYSKLVKVKLCRKLVKGVGNYIV
ncbi:hypothetical protein [Enterococcus phage UTI-EfS7]|uniref:Uncharacterized protein n=1 Tax=Enterococcus phage PMBT56 TaxID=3229530 RepID=A0AB39C677_9CAUD|nr:hypothetical protein [Enterococcus phage UTI-EfS7]